MTSAPALSASSTITATELRRFVQNRQNDATILKALESVFDAEPARAMLRHRMPEHHWREGQRDGADFHQELTTAVNRGTAAADAPRHLRPALRLLKMFHFEPIPEIPVSELTYVDERIGVRGVPDLVGHVKGRRAVIEIKTVHTIPHGYPFLEHSLQTALLFQLVWGHRPHSLKNFVRVLYIESTEPHRAFLLPVQMPNRFCEVAATVARHLLR